MAEYSYRPCPTHTGGGYDTGCPYCHHHNHMPPDYFPPGGYGPSPPAPGGYPQPSHGFAPPPGGYYPPPQPGYPPPPSDYPSAPPFTPGYRPSYPSYPYYWLDTDINRPMPPQAVEGGHDVDGHRIYVGRAYHDGDWLIAKVIPGKRATYISYNGQEVLKDRFQVLCGTGFYWQGDGNGSVPPRAVQGGRTASGEPLYVGRVHHEGSLTVGKIHPSHGVCYIPFDGSEHGHRHYEVLISNQ